VHIKFNVEAHSKRRKRPERGGQEATKSLIAFYLRWKQIYKLTRIRSSYLDDQIIIFAL